MCLINAAEQQNTPKVNPAPPITEQINDQQNIAWGLMNRVRAGCPSGACTKDSRTIEHTFFFPLWTLRASSSFLGFLSGTPSGGSTWDGFEWGLGWDLIVQNSLSWAAVHKAQPSSTGYSTCSITGFLESVFTLLYVNIQVICVPSCMHVCVRGCAHTMGTQELRLRWKSGFLLTSEPVVNMARKRLPSSHGEWLQISAGDRIHHANRA